MARDPSIVILTGAGVSAESGLDTFRTEGGIWSKKVDWRDVATPEGFARDPARVHAFYNMRRRLHRNVKPNAAHLALADLERGWPGKFLLVTQNVDNLHEQAGSAKPLHMHGEALKALCTACGARTPRRDDLGADTVCPACGAIGTLRPDVVWFGETPYHMDEITTELRSCTLFVSIGTSGNVQPAAGFAGQARRAGAITVELNLEPSQGRTQFDKAHYGPATEVVPEFVRQILAAI